MFENTMKVLFKVTQEHEAFIGDPGMMKGFGSTVVDDFTFGLSRSRNKVKKFMNRRFRAKRVKINAQKITLWIRDAR